MAANIPCRLKGCYSKDINVLAKLKMIDGCDIKSHISHLVYRIICSYTIKDCINVIISRGDIHDAYVKYYNRTDGNIDTSNKLIFHRELAFHYVDEYVNSKIMEKYEEFTKNEDAKNKDAKNEDAKNEVYDKNGM